jgi:predicted nucleic acid-binding protein
VKVLVDTSVWSLALRRRTPSDDAAVSELRVLVDQGRIAMIGPIRQEILSGIRDRAAFERLRDHLRAFLDETLGTGDFELAAEYFTTCRARGLQGSNTDFLICGVAHRHDYPILTTDREFMRFARLLPIALHSTS